MLVIGWICLWAALPLLLLLVRRRAWQLGGCLLSALISLPQIILFVRLSSGVERDSVRQQAEVYLSTKGISGSIQEVGWEQTLIAVSWISESDRELGQLTSARAQTMNTYFEALAQIRYEVARPAPEVADPIFLAHRWLGSSDSVRASLSSDVANIRRSLLAYPPGASPIYQSMETRWPADHAELWRVALSATPNREEQAAFERWWNLVKDGDFAAELDSNGQQLAPPRASSIAWILRHAAYLPVDLNPLYRALLKDYFIGLGPFAAFREYTSEHAVQADMDSGPIVFEIAAAPTTIGASAAVAAKDELLFWRLYLLDRFISTAVDAVGPSDLRKVNGSLLAIAVRLSALSAYSASKY
jgi:hypothetical protein